MGISIQKAYEPEPVDLWADNGGAMFVTVDVTRDLSEKVGAIMEKINVEEDTEKEVVLVGQLLDLKLKAKNPQTKKKPSELLAAKWTAGELGEAQLGHFLGQILTAGRPT